MNDLTRRIKDELIHHGADLVGIGDLSGLAADVRCGLPVGISVAIKFPKEIITGIAELPTQAYKNWYDALNEKLDLIVTLGAEALKRAGYEAIAQTRAFVGSVEEKLASPLPHKTVATRAGIGWIGKCALLVTEQYGSMVRLSSILTDAPLTAAAPVDHSNCGGCMVCANACPARAVSGKAWNVTLYRDDFYSPVKCRDTAYARSKLGFGGHNALCGKCIEICPYTQRYIKSAEI